MINSLSLSLSLPPSLICVYTTYRAILLGLACNEIATDVYLNLSSNELKSLGASVIETCLPDIRCLSGLDLSENSFDSEISNVITAVSRNKSLKRLSIGKNFINIKPK